MLEQTMFLGNIPLDDEDSTHNPSRGILLINCSIFCLSLTFLSSKFLYESHSDMKPSQLLFMRGVISTLFSMLWVNTKIKFVVWDSIPSH